MSDFTLRRITLQIEEVHHEGGPVAATPHLKGAIMAVCANPFAGRYVADLQPAMETLKPLALMLQRSAETTAPTQAHLRACQWFASRGEMREAVEHALWAGQPEVAANYLQRYGQEQLLIGVTAGGITALHTLPEPLVVAPAPALPNFAELLAKRLRKES